MTGKHRWKNVNLRSPGRALPFSQSKYSGPSSDDGTTGRPWRQNLASLRTPTWNDMEWHGTQPRTCDNLLRLGATSSMFGAELVQGCTRWKEIAAGDRTKSDRKDGMRPKFQGWMSKSSPKASECQIPTRCFPRAATWYQQTVSVCRSVHFFSWNRTMALWTSIIIIITITITITITIIMIIVTITMVIFHMIFPMFPMCQACRAYRHLSPSP